MNKLTNQIFKIGIIPVTAFLLFSCSNEPHDDTILKEKLNSQTSELKTVPLENSLDFFKKLNNSQLTKRDADTTGIGLVIDLESLEQVDVTDTDAELNIASATTKFDGVETEILQIEIDGELQTVLFHHVPEDSNTNKKTNKIASESFTGSVYSTDLGGRVLSGYRINKGTVSGSYNPSIYAGDPIKLREVVITNSYRAPVPINSNNTMMDYQFVRSTNNYSSMGIAYAAYFKSLAIKSFNDKIKEDQLKPCLQKILSSLKKISASPGNVIANFTGDGYSTNYNWNVKSGTLKGEASAETDPKYNALTGISTTFDSQKYKDATDLSWARTILHESIHAYLVTYYNVDKPGWLATYPEMIKDWGTKQNWNAVHHEEIARSLVKSVGVALEAYGVSQGYNLTKQFYEDMAWGGLQETDAYKALPKSDRNRISDTLSGELTGMDVNGDFKSQKGKKAGC